MSGAALLNVLMMDEAQAGALVAATAGGEERLAPRLVAAGPRAGRWVLPAAVIDGDGFAAVRGVLEGLEAGGLDAALAWPVAEEDG